MQLWHLLGERHRDLIEVSSLSTSHSICKLITPQERYEKEKKLEKLMKHAHRDMGKEFRMDPILQNMIWPDIWII